MPQPRRASAIKPEVKAHDAIVVPVGGGTKVGRERGRALVEGARHDQSYRGAIQHFCECLHLIQHQVLTDGARERPALLATTAGAIVEESAQDGRINIGCDGLEKGHMAARSCDSIDDGESARVVVVNLLQEHIVRHHP